MKSYPGCPLELQGRLGEEWGCGGVVVFVPKDPEDDAEEELDKELPGDWLLLLDKEKGPGRPRELQSSTETLQKISCL